MKVGRRTTRSLRYLKVKWTTALVLASPDFRLPFTTQCDASSYALGAVLTQEIDDAEHPVM